jgi:hypothetical protein
VNLKNSRVLAATTLKYQDLSQQGIVKYIFVLIFLVAINAFGFSLLESSRIGLVVNALSSPYNILILTFLLIFILQEKSLRINSVNNYFKYILWIATLIYLLQMLYSGSRSIFLSIILFSFFSILSLGIFKIKKIYLFLFAILVFLSFILFPFATHLRSLKNAGYDYRLIDQLNTFADNLITDGTSSIDIISLVPAFDRIAHLDFSVDLIKNADEYRSVVNFSAGFKSIIDGLTPGFDIFDAPKMANALQSVYRNNPTALSRINEGAYQSDQFGIYGEMYVLFYGWPSLPFFSYLLLCFLESTTDFKPEMILNLSSGELIY